LSLFSLSAYLCLNWPSHGQQQERTRRDRARPRCPPVSPPGRRRTNVPGVRLSSSSEDHQPQQQLSRRSSDLSSPTGSSRPWTSTCGAAPSVIPSTARYAMGASWPPSSQWSSRSTRRSSSPSGSPATAFQSLRTLRRRCVCSSPLLLFPSFLPCPVLFSDRRFVVFTVLDQHPLLPEPGGAQQRAAAPGCLRG